VFEMSEENLKAGWKVLDALAAKWTNKARLAAEAFDADEKLPSFSELRHRGVSHVSAGGRTYKVVVTDVTEQVSKVAR